MTSVLDSSQHWKGHTLSLVSPLKTSYVILAAHCKIKMLEPFVEKVLRRSKQWYHSIKASQVPLCRLYVHEGSGAPSVSLPSPSFNEAAFFFFFFFTPLLICKKVKVARTFSKQKSLIESSLFQVREKKKPHSTCTWGDESKLYFWVLAIH